VFNLATDADDPVLVFTTTWLRALAPHFESIDVVTMRKGRLDLPTNVTVHSLGKEEGRSEPVRALIFYGSLLRLTAHRRYAVCFAHQAPLFSVMAAPVLKARGIPTVMWYAHGSTPTILRVAEKVVDQVVTSSPEGFRLSSSKVTVVGQGVDTSFYVPNRHRQRATPPFTLVCAGRIAPVKGLELLVAAVEILAGRLGQDALHVCLIGPILPQDRAYADELRADIARRRLDQIVELVGSLTIEDLLREYQAADLLVNTSRTGSLDKVVLEAMSCCTPVVSSNPPYERILATVDRRLFVRRATAEAIAEACETVLRMPPEMRLQLGTALRCVVVEDHSLERLANLLVNEVFARHMTPGGG
jgi:glycosyltransferase involved in cell wall biosynthesis